MKKIIAWLSMIIGVFGIFYSFYILPTMIDLISDETGLNHGFQEMLVFASLVAISFGVVILLGKMNKIYEVIFVALAIIFGPIIVMAVYIALYHIHSYPLTLSPHGVAQT